MRLLASTTCALLQRGQTYGVPSPSCLILLGQPNTIGIQKQKSWFCQPPFLSYDHTIDASCRKPTAWQHKLTRQNMYIPCWKIILKLERLLSGIAFSMIPKRLEAQGWECSTSLPRGGSRMTKHTATRLPPQRAAFLSARASSLWGLRHLWLVIRTFLFKEERQGLESLSHPHLFDMHHSSKLHLVHRISYVC